MDGIGVLSLAALFGGYLVTPGPQAEVRQVAVDRLLPTKSDRQLETTNLTVGWLRKRYDPLALDLTIGATLTRPTGTITQLTGSYEEGTLRAVTYGSSAWGAGPTVQARIGLWRQAGFALYADLEGSVLFYDRPFPAGGDHYNGMFRAGPTLAWRLPSRAEISLGYRWMHVSNGQGVNPGNPSYEARGLSVAYRKLL